MRFYLMPCHVQPVVVAHPEQQRSYRSAVFNAVLIAVLLLPASYHGVLVFGHLLLLDPLRQ
jgi:hypothetical protein